MKVKTTMMDELELSPDSNDLLIDEDSHGDEDIKFEHSDTDLNMDLLDYEEGEEDDKAIKNKKSKEVEEEPKQNKEDKPTDDKKINRTPIVFETAAAVKDKGRQVSSSATGTVSAASALKDGGISPPKATATDTSDFCSKIGMKNVWLNFSEGDLKGLKTYHEFYAKYKPTILSANPTAPMPKINMVVASKWKEFLNVRKAAEKAKESHQVSSSNSLYIGSTKGGRNRKITDPYTEAFNKQDRAFNSSQGVKPAASVSATKVNLQFQRKPNPSLFSHDQPLSSFIRYDSIYLTCLFMLVLMVFAVMVEIDSGDLYQVAHFLPLTALNPIRSPLIKRALKLGLVVSIMVLKFQVRLWILRGARSRN